MKGIIKFFVLMSILFISSCQNDFEEIFDKTASERSRESVLDFKKVLKENKNGWIIHYFPNANLIYGGYSIFVKFTDDNQAVLTSDIDSRIIKTSYNVISETGTVLLFDTYNPIIHFFSEPGNDSGVGPADSGIGGDFQFIIQSADSKKVIMRGKDSNVLLEMHAIETDNFEKLAAEYREKLEEFRLKQTLSFELITNDNLRHPWSLHGNVFVDSEDANSPLMPFRVDLDGLSFYEEINFKGANFKKLYWRGGTTEFPAGFYEDEKKTVKLTFEIPPLNVLIGVTGKWYMDYKNMGSLSQEAFHISDSVLNTTSRTMNDVISISLGQDVGSEDKTGMYFEFSNGLSGALGMNFVPVEGTKDEVKFVYNEKFHGEISALYFLNFLVGGLIQFPANAVLNKQSVFKIEANSLVPSVLKMTDKNNPNRSYVLTRKYTRTNYQSNYSK